MQLEGKVAVITGTASGMGWRWHGYLQPKGPGWSSAIVPADAGWAA
jgi:hypothetical protein